MHYVVDTIGHAHARTHAQQAALTQLYQDTAGASWANTTNWLGSGTCVGRSEVNNQTVVLPSHCCWYGVQCCTDLACPNLLSPFGCGCVTLGAITQLRLPHNNLVSRGRGSAVCVLRAALKISDACRAELRLP